jgi:CO dehydrogenase/acetyl-CoA synthase alpha subunit
VQEIEKTVQFVEDKEKRSIKTVWIRSGNLDDSGDLFLELSGNLEFELKDIASIIAFKLSSSEKKLLSPLIGQCL